MMFHHVVITMQVQPNIMHSLSQQFAFMPCCCQSTNCSSWPHINGYPFNMILAPNLTFGLIPA